MSRINGPIKVYNSSDAVPTDAEGGYAGGDSTAAAIGTVDARAESAEANAAQSAKDAQTAQTQASNSAQLVGAPAGDVVDAVVSRVLIDVKAHGAVGDGITDDAAAIQAAIDAAAAQGGGRVVLPAGTYLVVGGLTLKTGVTLAGAPGAKRPVVKAGAAVAIWAQTEVNATDVAVEGVELDCAGQVTSYALQVSTGTARATIRDCTFRDATFTASVMVETRDATSDLTVTGCEFVGVRDGIRLNKNPKRVKITGNTIRQWRDRPIWIAGSTGFACEDVTIEGNAIIEDAFSGTADVRQPIQVSGVDTDLHRRVVVRRNTIVGNGHSWTNATTPGLADTISLHRCKDFEVSGNITTGSGDGGITIAMSCQSGVVAGNVIRDADACGIYLGSDTGPVSDVAVTGNTIINCGRNEAADRIDVNRAGVWAYNASGCAISGNQLVDDQGTPTMMTGVSLRTGTTSVTLSGNNYRGTPVRVNSSGASGVDFGSPRWVRKPSSTVRNNTATQAADPHLTVPVDPNATYALEAFIIYGATTAADWRAGYTAPDGASLTWTTDAISGGDTSSGAGALMDRRGVALATTVSHGGAGGQTIIARHVGTLTTAAAGGALTLQWAQTVAEVSDATVYGNSWLRLTRLA